MEDAITGRAEEAAPLRTVVEVDTAGDAPCLAGLLRTVEAMVVEEAEEEAPAGGKRAVLICVVPSAGRGHRLIAALRPLLSLACRLSSSQSPVPPSYLAIRRSPHTETEPSPIKASKKWILASLFPAD